MNLAGRLRHALEAHHEEGPVLLTGDYHDHDPAAILAPAAVLVAITDRPQPGVILTQRHAGLRHHAGQIAFPGGRIDPGDGSAVAAALREAQEEVALVPSQVEVIGLADRYVTVTGYDVTPVIGVVPPELALVPSEAEVADVFEVPFDFLLDSGNHVEAAVEWQGRERHYYEISWEGRRIWGATAAMIVNLSRRLRWTL